MAAVLEVSRRRYRCTRCGHVWHQVTSRAAEPRATLSRRGLVLTETQQHRLTELFAADAHVEVEAAWGIYQQIAGYREPDRTRGRELMRQLIESISRV